MLKKRGKYFMTEVQYYYLDLEGLKQSKSDE